MVTAEGTSTSTRNGKKHSDGSILLYFQDCGGQRQGLANSYSDIRVKTMGLHYPYDRVVGQLATPLLFYTIYSGIEKEFDYFCNTLKEQRITCSHLHTYPEIKLTKEQCAELLDVLQPESVNIDNEGSDRYQAVFNIPTLVITSSLFTTFHLEECTSPSGPCRRYLCNQRDPSHV